METQRVPDTLEFVNSETGELITSLLASFVGLVIFLLSISLLSHNNIDLPLGLVGILFVIGGILLAFGANKRITILHTQQPCEVITKRILTGKEIKETFTTTEIEKIDYLKGYEVSRRFTKARSEINLIMKNGKRIQVLKRWANKYFNIGVNKSLTGEATAIAAFLHIPLNTIDVTTLGKGIQTFGQALESVSHQDNATILFPNNKQSDDKQNTDSTAT